MWILIPKYQNSSGVALTSNAVNHRDRCTSEHREDGEGPGNTGGTCDQEKDITEKESQEQRRDRFF